MLRKLLACLCVAVALPNLATGQDGLSSENLAAVKAATVFVKVKGPGPGKTGTGFLFKCDDGTRFVVTNAHVVDVGGAADRNVQVIFHSGSGDERSIAATPVAEDAESDLAVLTIPPEGLPEESIRESATKPRETQSVFVLGFPFGEGLSVTRGNPAVTVSRASISSLRTNSAGKLISIQIDGELNPGNSGGPVVDCTGMLVGISRAKVAGTSIGFAIPSGALARLFQGKPGDLRLQEEANADGRIRVRLQLQLLDPVARIVAAGVNVIRHRESVTRGKPAAGEEWQGVPVDSEPVPLPVTERTASVDLTLEGHVDKDESYWFQPFATREDGTKVWGSPVEFLAAFTRGRSPRPPDVDPSVRPPPPKPKSDPAPAPVTPGPDDWLGSGTASGSRKGVITEPSRDLRGIPAETGGLKILDIKLPADRLVPCLTFSADGKRLYALESSGLLHQISVAGMIEERCLDTRRVCGQVELSAEALLLLVTGWQEIWVLDPESLATRVRIDCGSCRTISSGTGLKTALATPGNDRVLLVDLAARRVAGQFTISGILREHGKPATTWAAAPMPECFSQLRLSPDGTFAVSESRGILTRWRVGTDSIAAEECGPCLTDAPGRLEVSPDGRHLALLGNRGNDSLDPRRTGALVDAWIFKCSSLQSPLTALEAGMPVRALAIGGSRKIFLAGMERGELAVCDAAGHSTHRLSLPGTPGLVRQVVINPASNHAAVLTENSLIWMELPP